MIKGTCCCETVQFTLSEPPSMLGICHCSRCRKLGTSAMVFVKKEHLTWLQGKENISVFVPNSPYKYHRCFCKTCGTSLGEILSDQENFPISAHLLDADINISVQFHEFVSEKPSWHIIGDTGQQFEGHPKIT